MEKFIPLFPLPVVVFPGSPLPLHIFEPRYKEMIGECLERDAEFGVLLAQGRSLRRIGTTVKIENVLNRFPDGRLNILTFGKRRFEVLGLNEERAFLQGRVRFFDDTDLDTADLAAHLERSARILQDYARLTQKVIERAVGDDPQAISFFLAELVPYELSWRQRVLELTSCRRRFEVVNDGVDRYLSLLRLSQRLQEYFQVDAGFVHLVN